MRTCLGTPLSDGRSVLTHAVSALASAGGRAHAFLCAEIERGARPLEVGPVEPLGKGRIDSLEGVTELHAAGAATLRERGDGPQLEQAGALGAGPPRGAS